MPKCGKFIVFEGIDGSGKTTQLNKLKAEFDKHGVEFISDKEPTDGVIGRLARETIEKKMVVRPETLALLFAADRIEHIENTILPAINKGVSVLCDRFVFSSLAYQSIALPMEKIITANSFAIDTLLPDLTVFIDTEPEICMKRINENRSATELFESVEMARAIRCNYLTAFKLLSDKTNIVTIDGNRDEDDVFNNILSSVMPLFRS